LEPLHPLESQLPEVLNLAVYEDDIWDYLCQSHRLWTLMRERYPAAVDALAAIDPDAAEGPVIA